MLPASGCVTRTYWRSEIPSGSELRLFVSLNPSPSKARSAKRRGGAILEGQGAPLVQEGLAISRRVPSRSATLRPPRAAGAVQDRSRETDGLIPVTGS